MTDRSSPLDRSSKLPSSKGQRLSDEIQRLRVRAVRYGYQETAEVLDRALQSVERLSASDPQKVTPIVPVGQPKSSDTGAH